MQPGGFGWLKDTNVGFIGEYYVVFTFSKAGHEKPLKTLTKQHF